MGNCKTCNSNIIKGKYCSKRCYYISLKILNRNKICKHCGIQFISKQPSKDMINANKYCSKLCRQEYLSKTQRTGTYKICVYCNKEFYVKKCHSDYRCCSINCANKLRKGIYNPNFSISRSKLIADGKCNPKRNFYKQGWHHSIISNKDEWFGSSYEQKRMIQLDELKLNWTKKHGIRIKYIDPIGNERHYVPDFLINNNIIEEVKPFNLVNSAVDNNNLKHLAAIEYCKKYNYQYRIVTEKDLK